MLVSQNPFYIIFNNFNRKIKMDKFDLKHKSLFYV